jgi:hypothetical protein
LGPRRALTGEPLAPKLEHTAAGRICNPVDESPTVEGTPSQEVIDGDYRSTAQRNHDALNAGCEKGIARAWWTQRHTYGMPTTAAVCC